MTFRHAPISVEVCSAYFILSIESESPKIKHGLLVNFGKHIAKQAHSLCEEAMKTYHSDGNLPNRQLFRCCA